MRTKVANKRGGEWADKGGEGGELVHHPPSHYLVECTATSIDVCAAFTRLQGEWGSTNAGPYNTMHASAMSLFLMYLIIIIMPLLLRIPVSYRENYGMVCTCTRYGYGVCGYRCGVKNPDPRYTHAEP